MALRARFQAANWREKVDGFSNDARRQTHGIEPCGEAQARRAGDRMSPVAIGSEKPIATALTLGVQENETGPDIL